MELKSHGGDRMPDGVLPDANRTTARSPGGNPVAYGLGPTADLPEIPGYIIHHEIARGAMGRILAAHDVELDRQVAIKVILAENASDEVKLRFVRESKITARLPHPGIPPVHALGTLSDGRHYLVMKFVRGRTLAKLLKSSPGPASLLQTFEAICQTVAFAHAEDVIHRDLKPANVMVGAFGEVQVMDWGLARFGRSITQESNTSEQTRLNEHVAEETWALAGETTEDEEMVRTRGFVGTPRYMSPEQARQENDRVDSRSDVFSLGVMLCEILTGRVPFDRGTTALEVVKSVAACDLTEAFSSLDSSGADEELIELAKRCLAPDPSDRPSNAGVVADAIAAHRMSVEEKLRKAQVERAKEKVKKAEGQRRRRIWKKAILAVCLVLALGTIGTIIGFDQAGDLRKSLFQSRNAQEGWEKSVKDLAAVEADTLRMKMVRMQEGHGEELKRLGAFTEAEAAYRKAFIIEESTAARFRTSPAYRFDTVRRHFDLAETLLRLGRLNESEAQYYKALAILEDIAAAIPSDAALPVDQDLIRSGCKSLIGQAQYGMACVCAVASKLDSKNKLKHADEAMAWLQKAESSGIFRFRAMSDHFAKDKDLDPLRDRGDFQAFLLAIQPAELRKE